MEFALGKIYAKFYICQILKSMSYYDFKMKQLDFQMLIEENYGENDEKESMDVDEGGNKNPQNIQGAPQTSLNMTAQHSAQSIDYNNSSNSQSNVIRESMSNYDNSTYRRYFVFKGIVYSKVEIQGLVIEKRSLGYEEKNNFRYLIFIDDTTGVIQAISWKNKNDSVFTKIQNDLSPGHYVRLLGQVDYFLNNFEIVIEQIEVVKDLSKEILFHETLQRNQKAINESNIFNLLNLDNNIYKESNDKKKYAHQKKDFANRLLAFFQRYSINNEKAKDGFIELNISELFKIKQFSLMMEEFCDENNIEEKEKFFKECFNLLEEHSLGRLISREVMEIKVDDTKIKEDVMGMLKSSVNGKTYIEIFDEISLRFNNFFMNDYVKFILSQLVEEGTLMSEQNKYYILV